MIAFTFSNALFTLDDICVLEQVGVNTSPGLRFPPNQASRNRRSHFVSFNCFACALRCPDTSQSIWHHNQDLNKEASEEIKAVVVDTREE